MSVLTQTRRAKGTYPCASCNGVIFPGESHLRKVAKAGGKYASTRHHIVCPVMDPWITYNGQPPIPTRPVQKHFSEAGEKKEIDWAARTLAVVALVPLLIAVVGWIVSLWWPK